MRKEINLIMRIQRRIKGYTRKPYSTAVEQKIERAIEKECVRYGVSRSFVIANALAFTFNIDVEQYDGSKKEKANVVKFRKRKVS
jgi:hypothetical protein